MSFFSILVPSFRMAGKMQDCIGSLKGQSFTDFEVICVDDGSDDDTYACLEQYSREDPRFTALRHEENRGLLAARFTAMYQAKGDYVLFLDSDDYLSPETLEELHDYILQNPVDIVRFGYITEPDHRVMLQPESDDPLMDMMTEKITPAIWKNAYKLKVIKTLLERTEPFYCNMGEDVFFACCLFSCASSFGLISKVYHHYLTGGMSSASQTGSTAKTKRDLQSVTACGDHVLSFLRKYNPSYVDAVTKKIRTMKRFVLSQNTMSEPDYVKIVERLAVFDTEENRSIYEWGCRSFLPFIVKLNQHRMKDTGEDMYALYSKVIQEGE